jgi:hypothetical protein
VIWGWDISTSVIGMTVLDDDGRFVTSEYLDLRSIKDVSLLDKADESEQWIEEMLTKHIGDGRYDHFVEERLSNFAAGRTMLQTLMKLAAFNMVVSYMLLKKSSHVQGYQSSSVRHIHPSSVKAIMKREGLVIPKGADKKDLTLKFVQNKIPHFPVELNRNGNPQPWCFDKADSYIVARAAFLTRKKNTT